MMLNDILFWNDLPSFTRFSLIHVKHLVHASSRKSSNPDSLKAWQLKYAEQNFPMPIGHIGKIRYWSKIEVLDWCIENNPLFLEQISCELNGSEN